MISIFPIAAGGIALALSASCAFASQGMVQQSAFGGFETDYGPFPGARRFELDEKGTLYIADGQNHRILLCNSDRKCSSLGLEGSKPGEFSFPGDVALEPGGHVVVSDTLNDRIQVCSHSGECSPFRAEHLRDDGQLLILEPRGIAVSRDSEIWVTTLRHVYRCNLAGRCSIFVARDKNSGEELFLQSPEDAVFADDGTIAILPSGTGGNAFTYCDPDGECEGFGRGSFLWDPQNECAPPKVNGND